MRLLLQITLSIILLIFDASYTTIASELSWPQNETTPTESGFSESGIEKLDNAMRQIVEDQDLSLIHI